MLCPDCWDGHRESRLAAELGPGPAQAAPPSRQPAVGVTGGGVHVVQRRKLRLREAEWLVQGPSGRYWQTRISGPSDPLVQVPGHTVKELLPQF